MSDDTGEQTALPILVDDGHFDFSGIQQSRIEILERRISDLEEFMEDLLEYLNGAKL